MSVMHFLAATLSLEQALCYYLSGWQLFLVCVIVPMVLSFFGLWISRKIIPSRFLNQSHDVTGPFFSTLGTVYGIFLAFVVSTTWQQFSNTQSNLVQEARLLENLYFQTQAFSSPVREQLQGLLKDYRDSVLHDEWVTMGRGEASPKTALLLGQIGTTYLIYEPHNSNEASFLQESIKNLSSISGLRASRIDDSSSGLIGVLWFVLLIGAVATIGFSFLFGAHNFRAQAVMTMLLTGVISMTFFTIINLDFPFTGTTTISPESFQSMNFK
jgi:ABC-type multidrug transport system fused ATPase/permease subunit